MAAAIEDLALLFIKGLDSRTVAYLIDHFGSSQKICSATREELIAGAGLREDIAERIVRKEGFADAERELKYCARYRINAVAATDDEYPLPLREISDRPHVLFVQGCAEALSRRTLSMVGTRDMSPTGHYIASSLIETLARRISDLVIASGLDYGVNAACHRAAVGCGVPAVAVVSNVLPNVSSAHRTLADEILRGGGAVVSELHSQVRQGEVNFMARNRIIAGISMGLVVVEASATGGALTTAEMADGYGRQVMAVPGRVTDKSSFGANNLIRSGRARLVLTANDIIEDMSWIVAEDDSDAEYIVNEKMAGFSNEERVVYSAMDGASSSEWSQLFERSGLTIGEFTTALSSLEANGFIRAVAGGRYELV